MKFSASAVVFGGRLSCSLEEVKPSSGRGEWGGFPVMVTYILS